MVGPYLLRGGEREKGGKTPSLIIIPGKFENIHKSERGKVNTAPFPAYHPENLSQISLLTTLLGEKIPKETERKKRIFN